MNRFIFIISITMLLLTSCAVGQKKLSIVVTAQFETDAGYELALKELKAELERNNYQTTISYHEKGDELPNNDKIIVGDFESEEETGGSSINNEAYKISKVKGITPNVLEIKGDTKGGMYGIFKLAEELKLGKGLWDINMEMAPDFPMRMYTELGQLYDLPSVGYHLFEEPWVDHERFEREKNELKVLIDQVAKLGFNTFTIMHVNFEDYIT